MADVLVHITGTSKRKVEAALGFELEPVSPAGDLFRVPEEVAKLIGDLPESPPRASQSNRDKAAFQAMPVDPEKFDAEPVVKEEKPLHEAVVEASKAEGHEEIVSAAGEDEAPKSRSRSKSSK